MTQQLGVGIIGCGQVAQVIHLPTLYSLPELFRVVHLADASSSVVSRVAPGVDVRRDTDYQALLADPDVDVVLVATPDAYHARIAVDACRAGKRAVLVEKPLALTPGEARARSRRIASPNPASRAGRGCSRSCAPRISPSAQASESPSRLPATAIEHPTSSGTQEVPDDRHTNRAVSRRDQGHGRPRRGPPSAG